MKAGLGLRLAEGNGGLRYANRTIGERTGCFFLTAHTKTAVRNTESVLEVLQRREVSNTPAYGAKIAAMILGNEELGKMWKEDLVA